MPGHHMVCGPNSMTVHHMVRWPHCMPVHHMVCGPNSMPIHHMVRGPHIIMGGAAGFDMPDFEQECREKILQNVKHKSFKMFQYKQSNP
jgi:hypothetical protein